MPCNQETTEQTVIVVLSPSFSAPFICCSVSFSIFLPPQSHKILSFTLATLATIASETFRIGKIAFYNSDDTIFHEQSAILFANVMCGRAFVRSFVEIALCFFQSADFFLSSCSFSSITKCKFQYLFSSGNYCFHTRYEREVEYMKQRRFAISHNVDRCMQIDFIGKGSVSRAFCFVTCFIRFARRIYRSSCNINYYSIAFNEHTRLYVFLR